MTTSTTSQEHRDHEGSPLQPNVNGSTTTKTTGPSDSAFDLSLFPIRKIFTLIFIHDLQHNQLLLGKKQRGPLLGQWNGFGGKVERGLETIGESAARELAEEAFLEAPLFPVGCIQWVVESSPESVTKDPAYRDVMIVYKAHSLQPFTSPDPAQQHNLPTTKKTTPQRIIEFKASDEMAPGWWDINGLPWEDMRINHKLWYPFMLADRPFRGVYWYETRTSVEEGALNAQRETAKEIWVEDLARRSIQFGDRSLHFNDAKEGVKVGEGETWEGYARQLDLDGGCFAAEMSDDGKGVTNLGKETGWPEPTVNRELDDVWLRNDIAQAEQTWLNSHFP
ncbi:hypothetical protein BGZ96_001521 [Linnemannia gamsii]|uniref:Nudix hydrolase domain-containing protein n=1 Tax=Linnemannia gamsii TaxID=64522 RepID=A0ABQ7JM41_9FUNG|nr:hypothetical protein BGZ96_001521 [Linnemannia gamsii]